MQDIPTLAEMRKYFAEHPSIGMLPMRGAVPIVRSRTGCTDTEARRALRAVWTGEWHHKRVRRRGIVVPTGQVVRWYDVDEAIQVIEAERKEAEKMSKKNPAREVNEVIARELELFIVNDATLYRQMHVPIQRNLITKMARETYDSEKAIKMFLHLADEGAKRYVKEFGYPIDLKWFEVFTKPTRIAVAISLRDTFEVEAELGNYDHLLPKKYR